MGETYDVRSNVERLHENKYLEVFHRAARLDLVKKLEMMEYIARSPLARMRTQEQLRINVLDAPAPQRIGIPAFIDIGQ